MQEKEFEQSLSQQFFDSQLPYFESKSYRGEYGGSDYQLRTYSVLEMNDNLYKNFITQNYGSFENYSQRFRINQTTSVYNPLYDYTLDVKIVNESESYTSDHISPQEVILEELSGVCTVFFIKKSDNSIRRITGTLDSKYLPTKEYNTRKNFFTTLPGDRVGIWDINAQQWKSFYMSNVIRFVRDDTVGTE